MISIVVLTHNQKVLCEQCVNAIYNDMPAGTEVNVIGNGASYTISDTRPRIFSIPNTSVPAARNYGVSISTGDPIIFIDDDIIISAGFIKGLIAPLINPLVGIVGVDALRLLDDFSGQWNVAFGEPFDYFDSPYLVRRACYNQVGGFDEAVGWIVADNTDLCIQARRWGWGLVHIPDTLYTHAYSSTIMTKDSNFIHSETLKAKVRLQAKYGSSWRTELGMLWPLFPINKLIQKRRAR